MYTASITVNKKKKTIKKEKILTIGIITKNEKIKLERCLKSLMPLKEALDCEIIVTDTGSTDGTVEMARGYADKVIDYKWNDNFSDARNTGIKAAKGLWFMWIDSDEEIEKPEGLIEFFKSGEYKQYAAAALIFRDYQNSDKDSGNKSEDYLEIILRRLILLADTMKFEGSIHENIMEVPPLKYLTSILNHNMCDFQSKDEKLVKRKRNLVPLLESYDKNPKNVEIINYLIREYFAMEDYDNSIKYCQRSIEEAEKIVNSTKYEAEKNYMTSCILYAKLRIASAFYNTDRATEIIDILKNEVDDHPKASFLFIDVYGLIFKAYDKMNDKEKAIIYAEKYIEKYSAYINDKLDKEYVIGLFISLNSTQIIKENISFILDYYMAVENFDKTMEYLEILEYLNLGDSYVKLKKIKCLDYFGSKEDVKHMLAEILENEDFEITATNSPILYFSLKYNIGVEKISQKIDIQKISSYTKVLIDNNEDIVDVVYDYYKEAIKKDIDMDTCHIIISLLESYTVVKNDIESLNIIFELYSGILPGFLEKMYNENILNEKYIRLLSPVLQFGYYIEKAGKLRLKEEIPSYIKELKKAVMAYPIMFKPVKAVINDMEEEMRKEQERDNEFSKLAKKIKEKIYQLIIEGNDKEALSIIAQLQSLIPHDEELKMLKNQMALKGKMGFGKNKLLN